MNGVDTLGHGAVHHDLPETDVSADDLNVRWTVFTP